MKIARHIKSIPSVLKTFSNPFVYYLNKLGVFSEKKIISVSLKNGLKIKMHAGNSSINNIPECYFTDFFAEMDKIAPSSNFIDLGASIGVVSLLAAMKGCNVFSFEPDPARFYLLKENIDLNDFGNKISAYKLCIASGRGQRRLSGYSIVGAERGGGDEIACVGLDDIFELTGIETIDFLKMDVEGAELEILKNARCLERVRKIAVEVHEFASPKTDILSILENNNFSVRHSKDFSMLYADKNR